MTTPDDRKSLKVSAEIHRAVHDLSTALGTGSVDEALKHVLGMSTVRVPVSDAQRARWTAYAEASGVSLAEWITLRVEAAIQYGSDPGTMHVVLDHVRALAAAARVNVPRTSPPRPGPRPLPVHPNTNEEGE